MNGKQLKNSILQWAIQGKLVPQNPNDEPASVLLDKIRQEKERLIKEKKIKRDKNASIIYRGEDNSYYEKILATGEVKCIDEEVPFEIPASWSWARLTHVTYLIEDCPHSTAKDEGKGYPLVRTPNIGFGFLQLNGVHRVSEKVYNQRNVRAVPQKDDLIFAREAPAGNIAVIQNEKVCLGQRTVLLRPITDCILPQYLAYYVLAPSSQQNLVEKSSGTTVAHVNLSDFRPYLIAVPPIDEQKQIVNKLIELLSLIDKYNCYGDKLAKLNNEIYTLLKKSILQEAIQGKLVPQIIEDGTAYELLEQIKAEKQNLVKEGKLKKSALATSVIFRGDDNKYYEQIGNDTFDITDQIPFDIPSQWSWVRLKEVCTICTGATFKKEEAKQENNGIRVLRGGNILPYQLQLKPDDIYISEEKVKSNILLKTGDIVTPAVTSLENIGKMAKVEEDMRKVTVGGFVFIIRPFYVNTFSQYLLYFMSSPIAIEYMKSITNKSGQAFYNIGKERLATTLIPIPPLCEQERIIGKVIDIFNKIKG